jgi:signal transduction histidine kinase/tetratricopeptide (TPR) repeat protein
MPGGELMQVGRFRLIEQIGMGGMATVYKAEDASLHSRPIVAMKLLNRPKDGSGLDFLAWRRELEALSSAGHPNIVRLLDFGEEKGRFFLVTEYIEGVTLEDFCARGPLDSKTAVGIALQLVAALRYAHSRDIIHLDLKPKNILLTGDPPVAKILDFGLARFLQEFKGEASPPLAGTLLYMAPEQLDSNWSRLGGHTDLYALGMILYGMLAGRSPFDTTDVLELMQCKREGSSRPLESLVPTIPKALSRIVERLICPWTTGRYRSAEGVVRDLDLCLRKLAAGEQKFDFAVGEKDRPWASPSELDFVGRQEETTTLRNLFSRCRRGQGQVVLLHGPAGIGKSRLMAEFGLAVEKGGGIYLTGKATRTTRGIPYYPFLVAFSEYLERTAKAEGEGMGRQAVLDAHERLAGNQSSGDYHPDIEHSRERFLQLVVNVILGAAAPASPLVMVIDDLQWADQETVELVERIAARVGNQPVLLVGSYRDQDLDAGQRLSRVLSRLAPRAAVLALSPLRIDEIHRVAGQMLGDTSGQLDELASFLMLHAEGNPFNSIALVASLVEERVLAKEATGWSVQLDRLRAFVSAGKQARLVEAQVLGLQSETVLHLEWAAAIGSEFNLGLLATLGPGEWEEGAGELEASLDAARQEGIVRKGEEGRFAFTHDHYRDYLYSRLGGAEKQRRHQKIAEAIETRAGDLPDNRTVLDLAEHFSRGLSPEKAFRYTLRALEVACRTHAYGSAMQYAKKGLLMLQALKGRSETAPEAELLLRRSLGDAYAASAEYDRALEQYAKAIELVPSRMARAEIEGRQASVYVMKGELKVAARLMEHALGELGMRLPGSPLRTRISALGSALALAAPLPVRRVLGRPLGPAREEGEAVERMKVAMLNQLTFTYFFFNMESAFATHLIALRLAEALPPSAETIETRAQHAAILPAIPMRARALRYGTQSLAIARELGQPHSRTVAAFYVGVCNYFLGRWDQAEACFGEVVALFPETGDVFLVEMAHENIGFCAFWQGELDAALVNFHRALELATGVGDSRGMAVTSFSLAWTYGIKGNQEQAEEFVQQASRLLGSTRDHSLESSVLRTVGLVSLYKGEREEAKASLEKALGLVRQHKLMQEYVAPIFSIMVSFLASRGAAGPGPGPGEPQVPPDRGSLKKMRRLARQALSFGKRFSSHEGAALRSLALVELAAGRVEKARTLLARSADVLLSFRMRYELALTYEAWADAYDPADPGHSGCLLNAARLYDEVGAAPAYGRLVERLSSGAREGRTGAAAAVAGLPRSVPSEGRQLRSLIEVGKALASTLDLDDLIKKTMDSVMEVAGAERGLLLVRNPEKGNLDIRIYRCREEGREEPAGDFSSRSVTELVLRTRQPVLVSDALTDPRLAGADSVYARQLRSILCFPILAQDEPWGLIYLENNVAAHCFSRPLLDLIRVFAAQASIALENGLAYRKIEQLNLELEEKVRRRTAQLESASGELRDRNEQLASTIRELTTTRDRMIHQAKMASVGLLAAGATHEINNPLSFVQGGAFAMARDVSRLEARVAELAGADPAVRDLIADTRNMSDIVLNGCDRIKGIVDGLWCIAGHRESRRERFDIRSGIESTVKLWRSAGGREETRVELCLDPMAEVLGSPGELNQVLLNLLKNAGEASPKQCHVTVRTFMEKDRVCLSVRDRGAGIPEVILPHVFEPFFTTKGSEKGKGLGLSICMRIVEEHGGALTVNSRPGEGAVFTVSLPAAPGPDRSAPPER